MKIWILYRIIHWFGYEGFIVWGSRDTFKITGGYFMSSKEKIIMSTKDEYNHFYVYKNNKYIAKLVI